MNLVLQTKVIATTLNKHMKSVRSGDFLKNIKDMSLDSALMIVGRIKQDIISETFTREYTRKRAVFEKDFIRYPKVSPFTVEDYATMGLPHSGKTLYASGTLVHDIMANRVGKHTISVGFDSPKSREYAMQHAKGFRFYTPLQNAQMYSPPRPVFSIVHNQALRGKTTKTHEFLKEVHKSTRIVLNRR